MRNLIFIGVGLVLFSWFVIGEKRSVWDKIFILVAVVGVYVAYRLMGGATMEQIIAPLFTKPESY